MYKEDLVLNNLQGLICHKTQPNQNKPNQIKLSFLFFDGKGSDPSAEDTDNVF